MVLQENVEGPSDIGETVWLLLLYFGLREAA